MNKFYFTFSPNTPFANCYMIVEAPTEQEARKMMLLEYGQPIWILSFTEENFKSLYSRNRVYTMYECPFGYMPEEAPWLSVYSLETAPIHHYPTGRTLK